MKNYLSSIAFGILAVVGLVACSDTDDLTPRRNSCNLTLTLTMGGDELATRASTEDGVPSFNENIINRVDLFLYPTGGTGSNALFFGSYTPNIQNQATIQASISTTELNALFPNGATHCEAFVIVNRPTDTTIGDNTDVETLRKLAIANQAGFTSTVADGSYFKGVIPAEFVMSGSATDITLDASSRTVTGNIDVKRSAAKVTLELTDVVDEFVDDEDITWVPIKESIRIHFKNGQYKGFVDAPELKAPDNGIFSTRNLKMNPIANNTTHYTTDVPLYTYPTNWSNNIDQRTSITVCIPWKHKLDDVYVDTYYDIPINDLEQKLDRNTYYKLMLKVGIMGSKVEEQPLLMEDCSYTILPWGQTTVVNATLGMVRYLTVSENYVIVDNVIARMIYFATSHPVEIVNMKIERKDLRGTVATWSDQKISAGGYVRNNDYFSVPIYYAQNENESSYFVVEHQLVNTMDKDADYTDYRLSFTIRHEDDHSYSEEIIVLQHPMIIADAEINSDFNKNYPNLSNLTDNQISQYHNQHYGYVLVNGKRNNSFNGYSDVEYRDLNISDYYYDYYGYYYGGTHGLAGMNKNPNRYKVNVTSLTTDKYVIGDPRTRIVNNDLSQTTINSTTESTAQPSWSAYVNNQYSIEGNYRNYGTYQGRRYYEFTNQNRPQQRTYYAYALNRGNNNNTNKLLYYHPTDETDALTKGMIAPEFMVASSYGVCTTGRTQVEARRRCAAYQEDGYPAGRWRLPTKAEVEYIVNLSAWGIIPILFGDLNTNEDSPSPYWSANGLISVNNYYQLTDDERVTDGGTESGASVRCVYDLWYWGDDKIPDANKGNFYWGDKSTF